MSHLRDAFQVHGGGAPGRPGVPVRRVQQQTAGGVGQTGHQDGGHQEATGH